MHVRARAAAATTHVRAGYRRCKFTNRAKPCPFVPGRDSIGRVGPEIQVCAIYAIWLLRVLLRALFASTVTVVLL
jgi:hypothetical protein